jgi:hypothetical protein
MTEREKPWTAERLRALLPGGDADAVPLLNEPDEHLPPARFRLEPAGWKSGLALPELENGQLTASSYAEYWLEADLALQSQPLREWKKERREAFEQEARRVLGEGDERTRQQWSERIETLDAVLDGVADEKEKGRIYSGKMSAEERRTGLVALEKRTLRARAKYASRREVLRQEEDRAHTGEISEKGHSSGSETEEPPPVLTGYRAPAYAREARQILDDHASVSTFGQLAGKIGEQTVSGNSKVDTLKRAIGYNELPREEKTFARFKELLFAAEIA